MSGHLRWDNKRYCLSMLWLGFVLAHAIPLNTAHTGKSCVPKTLSKLIERLSGDVQMFGSALILILTCLEANDEIDRLVSAQQSSLALFQSLDMEIDVYPEPLGGKTGGNEAMWQYRWSMAGRKERQRYQSSYRSGKSDTWFGDLMNDGNSQRQLKNFDPKSSVKLSPDKPSKVVGSIHSHDADIAGMFPYPLASFMCQAIQTQSMDSVWSVPEFIKGSGKVEFRGSVKEGETALLHVRAEHPHSKTGGSQSGVTVDLYFDPSAGYLIRKQVAYIPKGKMAPAADGTIERNVKEFSRHGDGVFLPIETTLVVRVPGYDGPIVQQSRLVAKRIVINKELPSDAFDFHFPENAQVADFTNMAEGRPAIFLWGKDDQPGRRVISGIDLLPPPENPSRSIFQTRSYLISVACLVLIALGFLYYRRFRSTSQ